MRSWKKWVLPCLCLAWMIVIWQFSCSPAGESAAESSQVQEFLNGVLEKTNFPLRFNAHTVRKTAHFTEFFVLGVLAGASMLSLSLRHPFLYALPVPILTAAADECIQKFVPGRAALLTDVLLDSAGGCTGLLCLFLIWRAVAALRARSGRADRGSGE